MNTKFVVHDSIHLCRKMTATEKQMQVTIENAQRKKEIFDNHGGAPLNDHKNK